MAGAAELFTVCGSCGQQVSTFVTECPYCGTRLRKRAPRLDRKDGDLEALFQESGAEEADDDVVVPLRSPAKARRRRLALKRSKGPGRSSRSTATRGRRSRVAEAVDGRPWATLLIVLVSLIGLPVTVLIGRAHLLLLDGGLSGAPVWRFFTAAVTYVNTWHALAVLTCFGVFGWLWERRAGALGAVVVLGTFLVAGVGGLVVATAANATELQAGASGAATALAAAWIVAELRARQRGESLDGDLLGASVLLAVPLLTSLVVSGGAPVSAALGVVLGAGLGLALAAAHR